ncbi:MAG: hypothetical protein AB7J32_02905 [Pseudonocardia sp.]
MVLDLSRPLSWRSAIDTVEMLDNLQAGIVAPHARSHLRVLAVRFADALSARTFLAALVEEGLVKSERVHLAEREAYEAAQVPGSPQVTVGLTHAGYRLLTPWPAPDDPLFATGVRGGIDAHVIVTVADTVEAPVLARLARVQALLPRSASVGPAEAAGPRDVPDGVRTHPDDGGPLAELLVPEPGAAADDNRFGSYAVYRRLGRPGGTDVLAVAVGAAVEEPPLPPGWTVRAGAYLFLPSLPFLRSL